MMRAQIQADLSRSPEKARELLHGVADRTDSSAPGQLAGLEIDRNRLMTLQPSSPRSAPLEGGRDRRRARRADRPETRQAPDAVEHFDTALKKDPDNKIIQFWKAQLDGRRGAVTEAARALEAIVRNKPVKEVDPGTTLLSAAQSALANLSLQTGALDDAIRRFEELKRNSQTGTLTGRSPVDHGLRAKVSGPWPARTPRSSTIPTNRRVPRSRVRAPISTARRGRRRRPSSTTSSSSIPPTVRRRHAPSSCPGQAE